MAQVKSSSSWGITRDQNGIQLRFGKEGAQSSMSLTVEGASALATMIQMACDSKSPFSYQEASVSVSKTAGPKAAAKKKPGKGKG